MSARMDRIADAWEEDAIDDEPEADFEPCRSCPWPGSCTSRGGCEADG